MIYNPTVSIKYSNINNEPQEILFNTGTTVSSTGAVYVEQPLQVFLNYNQTLDGDLFTIFIKMKDEFNSTSVIIYNPNFLEQPSKEIIIDCSAKVGMLVKFSISLNQISPAIGRVFCSSVVIKYRWNSIIRCAHCRCCGTFIFLFFFYKNTL